MQSDAPVMIILGTLVVITALGTMFAILDDFGGSQFSETGTSFGSFQELHSSIEDQCSRLDEYDRVLSDTIELNLDGTNLRYESPDLILEQDDGQDAEREVSCNYDVDFIVIEPEDDGSSNWAAEISSEEDEVFVEVKP